MISIFEISIGDWERPQGVDAATLEEKVPFSMNSFS